MSRGTTPKQKEKKIKKNVDKLKRIKYNKLVKRKQKKKKLKVNKRRKEKKMKNLNENQLVGLLVNAGLINNLPQYESGIV